MLVVPDEDVAVCRRYMHIRRPLGYSFSGGDVAVTLGGRDASRVVNQIKSRTSFAKM